MSVKAIHRRILIQADVLHEQRKKLKFYRRERQHYEDACQLQIAKINETKRKIFELESQLEEKDR